MMHLVAATHGKIDQKDLIPIFATPKSFNEEQVKHDSILKRCSERYKQQADYTKWVRKNMNDLLYIFDF